jgi:uncharacterized protein (TIGR00369 family)
MIPAYANFGGKIHGGILLSLMDKVAFACASKHSGAYCVTVSVDGVNFRQAVEVGELVSLMASVNYVGRTSMVIGIKVIAENVRTGTVKHTNTSYFTMVATDDDHKTTEVPPTPARNAGRNPAVSGSYETERTERSLQGRFRQRKIPDAARRRRAGAAEE